MPRPENAPNRPGRITLTALPSGAIRAKARMRLLDYARRDEATGAYMPGARVDLYATVASAEDAPAAIQQAADRRIARAKAEASGVNGRALATLTVADLASESLAALELSGDLSDTSLSVYRLHCRKHLEPSPLGRMRATAVASGDVAQYLTALIGSSGIATARQGRALLGRAYAFGIGSKLVTSNPTRDLGQLRAPRGSRPNGGAHLDHDRALTAAERVTLAWAVARDARAGRLDLRDLVLCGLAVGARIGELLAVRWCDIEFTDNGGARMTIDGTVTRVSGRGLARTRTKTETSVRTLPLPRRVAALLRRRARVAGVDLSRMTEDTRPVFPAPGRWGAPGESEALRDTSNTAKALRKTLDRAGFGWASFHTLRRSAITSLVKAHGLSTAAAFAGHGSVRTTLEAYTSRDSVLTDEVVRGL